MGTASYFIINSTDIGTDICKNIWVLDKTDEVVTWNLEIGFNRNLENET